MRHWPAASAATTAPGGTATPLVRLRGARRGCSRPRSRQAVDRSVNAPRPPALRPSPTGIEGRRCKIQASLSFGHRPAARPAVCGAPLYLFEHPRRAERGPCHCCPAVGAPQSGAAERLRASSQRRSGLSRGGPHGLAVGRLIFGHWHLPHVDSGERTSPTVTMPGTLQHR